MMSAAWPMISGVSTPHPAVGTERPSFGSHSPTYRRSTRQAVPPSTRRREPWAAPLLVLAALSCLVARRARAPRTPTRRLRVIAVLCCSRSRPARRCSVPAGRIRAWSIVTSLALDALARPGPALARAGTRSRRRTCSRRVCFPVLVVRLLRGLAREAAVTAAAFEPAWVGEVELAGADRRRRRSRRLPTGARSSWCASTGRRSVSSRSRWSGRGAATARRARRARARRAGPRGRGAPGRGRPRADELGVAGLPQVAAPRCAAPGPHPERAEGLASVVVCTRDRPDRCAGRARQHPGLAARGRRGDRGRQRAEDGRGAHRGRRAGRRARALRARAAARALARPQPRRAGRARAVPGLHRRRRARGSGLARAAAQRLHRAPRTWAARPASVLAAELETSAQAYIEQRLDWSAFREPRIYDVDAHRSDDAMFPFSAGRFGTGRELRRGPRDLGRARRARPAARHGHAGDGRRGPGPVPARAARRPRARRRVQRDRLALAPPRRSSSCAASSAATARASPPTPRKHLLDPRTGPADRPADAGCAAAHDARHAQRGAERGGRRTSCPASSCAAC